MKKRTRIFLDIAIPVALYSFVILVSQLVVALVFTVVYFAAYAGADLESAGAGLEPFLLENSNLISLISTLLVMGVILIDARIKRVKVKDYTLIAKPIGARNTAMAMITGVAFSSWISAMLVLLPIPDSLMSKYTEVSSFISSVTPLDFISVCLAAPLVEEMVFRGIVYKHLRICMPEYPAIILQAVLFAVLHEGSIIWMAYALIAGLLFGYINMLTGSIRTSVWAHIMFNTLSFLPLGNNVFAGIALVSPVLLIVAVRDIYKQSVK